MVGAPTFLRYVITQYMMRAAEAGFGSAAGREGFRDETNGWTTRGVHPVFSHVWEGKELGENGAYQRETKESSADPFLRIVQGEIKDLAKNSEKSERKAREDSWLLSARGSEL